MTYGTPVKEAILRVVQESPGISFEQLATRIGVCARTPAGRLNSSLNQTLSHLEKDGHIERKHPEFAKGHEPKRIYPAGYVPQRRKRPLFQKVNPPPVTVRRATPEELNSSQRKPTVRALQREPIEDMGSKHETQRAELEAALEKFTLSGKEFSIGHVCRAANLTTNHLTKFPELGQRIREAARNSQERAKLDKITRVEFALDAAIRKGTPFTKAEIARTANVDVNFIDALPELKDKIREAVHNPQDNSEPMPETDKADIASAAQAEELRYQLDRLKQQLHDSNERNRELRQQLAEAQEKQPQIVQSPLDAFRLGLTSHEQRLAELHDRAVRLSNHLEMLNEQIAQEEATMSHYRTLLEIESRAIPSPTNGNSKKVEIPT
jgi:chromosome segregation ATPase